MNENEELRLRIEQLKRELAETREEGDFFANWIAWLLSLPPRKQARALRPATKRHKATLPKKQRAPRGAPSDEYVAGMAELGFNEVQALYWAQCIKQNLVPAFREPGGSLTPAIHDPTTRKRIGQAVRRWYSQRRGDKGYY